MRDISVLVQKKHWFESTHGNGSFQWKFHYVTMETGPVGQIMAENPVFFQFLPIYSTTALLHFRHRRFGLKVVHGRPQNLGKSSEKSPQLRRTNICWVAKAGTGTQLMQVEMNSKETHAMLGLGLVQTSASIDTIDPKDPIDPRLVQQNNATGFRLCFYMFLSSIIILHLLLPFLKWLPSLPKSRTNISCCKAQWEGKSFAAGPSVPLQLGPAV